MKIKTRLSIVTILVAIIPLLLSCIIIGYNSYLIFHDSSTSSIKSTLMERERAKRDELQGYFGNIDRQVRTFASSYSIQSATEAFIPAYASFNDQVSIDANKMKSSVQSYYKNEFASEFKRQNDTNFDASSIYRGLNDTTYKLQYTFISDNPNPPGSKHLLNTSGDSDYAKAHATFHPGIRQFLEEFGYYDIFIVDDNSGNIIYSVFKELDFATSLKTGPYANSGIAKVFKASLQNGNKTVSNIVDFESYLPSYMNAASFIASPIIKDGKRLGTLIFQMPVDRINALMTYDGNWAEAGLGASGEVYLVNSKGLMLNNSRFLSEDKDAFITALNQSGESSKLIDRITATDSTIGMLSIDSQGFQAALNGQRGFEIYKDYRGVEVLSAYAPFDFLGLRWAILSEIDSEEAFAPTVRLKEELILEIIIFAFSALVISTLTGWLLARQMTTPITNLAERLQEIEDKSDLTLVVEEQGDEEISNVAKAINTMLTRIRNILVEIADTSNNLKTLSEQLNQLSHEASQGAEAQQHECREVETAAIEMSTATSSTAEGAADTSIQTSNARQYINETKQRLQANINVVTALSGDLEQTSTVINSLASESENIGQVLEVITGIAEQTNLLALNAAIEAARAGDAGRGFAVVADEVRTLAHRTQTAIGDIHSMIEAVQTGSSQAVKAVEMGREKASKNVSEAALTDEALTKTINSVEQIADTNESVATAAEEQSVVARNLSERFTRVNEIANQTSERSAEIATMSEDIDLSSRNLDKQARQFKV